MAGRNIIIFGAYGQLGTSLMQAFDGDTLIAGDRDTVDITDREKIRSFVTETRPDIIVNAAAYNSVEKAGEEIREAYAANAFGPFFIAESAAAVGASFVHVSSDYVFDGEQGDYIETDIPSPINAYGASKRAGEELVTLAGGHAYIIRTSALFGFAQREGKKNFVQVMIAKGKGSGEIPVVNDQYTVPTSASDLAAAIKALLEKKAAPGIYHMVNAGSTTWAGFAEEIFRQTDVAVKVRPITTAESGTKIRRPRSTVLKTGKIAGIGITLPPWQDGLRRYLEDSKGRAMP